MSGSGAVEAPGGRSASEGTGSGFALLCAVAVNAAAGTLFAWSVLLPALSAEFGLPAGELGIVFSGALVVFALAVLFCGHAVDRQGPRRGAALAGVLSGGGLAVASVAQTVPMLHLGIGGLFGFGSGLAYLSVVSWASTRGGKRRVRAIGVVVAAYAAGPVASAPLGTWGVERLGWRPTLAVAAVIVSVVVLLASRGLPGPLSPRRAGARPVTAAPVGDATALVALWVLFFAAVAPGLLAFAYAAAIATERGISTATAGLVVALMALGNLAGRLLSSPLSTRCGLRAALWTSVAVLVLAVVTLAASVATAPVVLALPLLALQYGLVSALLPAATREVSGDLRFGAAYGRVFSSFGAAAVAGPALGAVLHDGADGYAGSFRVSLLAAAVAVAALAIYERRLRLTGVRAGSSAEHETRPPR